MATPQSCSRQRAIVACVQVGAVLGVSYAQQSADIVNLNVAGFVWVLQVDASDSSITLMCPHATPPPGSLFIVGTVRKTVAA